MDARRPHDRAIHPPGRPVQRGVGSSDIARRCRRTTKRKIWPVANRSWRHHAKFFLSPTEGPFGITIGAGPVFLYPTATDELLGTGKWGAGPTAVVLKQFGGWTVGALMNQIWSFAGDSDRSYVSRTFL